MSHPVLIDDYNPEWPRLFEEEKLLILEVLRGLEIPIEHVGSTSVPGLAAKPIIDILGILPDASVGPQIVGPLTTIGYFYKGEFGIPGRIYFTKGWPSKYHLHVYPLGHPEIERHLVFRDYLRAHPDAAREYAELKRRLAEQFGSDRERYTMAKTDIVRSVEARARANQA